MGVAPGANLQAMKQEFSRFQLKDTDTIRGAMQTISGNLTAARAEVEGLKQQLATAGQRMDEKDAQIKQAEAMVDLRRANGTRTCERGYFSARPEPARVREIFAFYGLDRFLEEVLA